MEGKVDLDSRFLDIRRYEKHLLVFWMYDLSLVCGGKSQFVAGMVPLRGPHSSAPLVTCKDRPNAGARETELKRKGGQVKWR